MIQTPIQGIGIVVNLFIAMKLSDKIKSREPVKDFRNAELGHSLDAALQPIVQIATI